MDDLKVKNPRPKSDHFWHVTTTGLSRKPILCIPEVSYAVILRFLRSSISRGYNIRSMHETPTK
jgi:hypothetical protein